MTKPEPQLVTLEDGRIGMMLRLGQFTATMPLPERMAGYSKEELKEFFDGVVPTMMENLLKMQNDHRRKLHRKVTKKWDSTKPSPESEAEMPNPHRQPS